MAPLGPVHVRLSGVVRGDDKGPGIGIVNAPTAAEATAELHRVARVAGADKVVSVASDYRRAALAGGTTSTQWRIEVQAWGTAMAPAKIEPGDEAAEKREPDAEKAKDQDDARKAQDAQNAQDEALQAKANAQADSTTTEVQTSEPAPVVTTSPPVADSGAATESAPAAVPSSSSSQR
jgi:hypothetical protein